VRRFQPAFLAALAAASGCAVDLELPRDWESGERVTHLAAPAEPVRARIHEILSDWGLELRSERPFLLRTRKVREGDYTWRLQVEVSEAGGTVAVVTRMEIHRSGEFDVRISERGLESVVRRLLGLDPDEDVERIRDGRRLQGAGRIKREIMDAWKAAVEERRQQGEPAARVPRPAFWHRLFHFTLRLRMEGDLPEEGPDQDR
jgi:hypothetical protein